VGSERQLVAIARAVYFGALQSLMASDKESDELEASLRAMV
jgi:hypothetical protein